jgi:hypothetical protein
MLLLEHTLCQTHKLFKKTMQTFVIIDYQLSHRSFDSPGIPVKNHDPFNGTLKDIE